MDAVMIAFFASLVLITAIGVWSMCWVLHAYVKSSGCDLEERVECLEASLKAAEERLFEMEKEFNESD